MSSPDSFPTIPAFEILEVVARTARGTVYRARSLAVGHDVAIKVLSPAFSTPEASRRLLDEARIMGQLQHPGIPPVHYIGELPDGSAFVVMKLIKGRPLAQALEDRSTPSSDLSHFLAVF